MDALTFNNFAHINIITDDEQNIRRDDVLQRAIVEFSIDVWNKCDEGLRKYDILQHWQEIDNAYMRKHDYPGAGNIDWWKSRVYLPWTKQAILSASSYLTKQIFGNELFFSLKDVTNEDQRAVDLIQDYLGYLVDSNDEFSKILGQAVLQDVKKGSTVIKGFWSTIISYLQDFVPVRDVDGAYRQEKKVTVNYHNPDISLVKVEDFRFYPYWGNFNDAVKIERKSTTYSQLMAESKTKKYYNLDRLERYNPFNNSSVEGNIELWEVEITKQQYVAGKVLKNIKLLIVDKDFVIYDCPLPFDYGLSQYFYSVCYPIEGTNFGEGLCFGAIDLQRIANLKYNGLIDNLKLAMNQGFIAPKSMINQDFTMEPGLLLFQEDEKLASGIVPQPIIFDMSKFTVIFQEMESVRAEFERETVSEFIQGVSKKRDETATRDLLVQEGSDNRLNGIAKEFNNGVIKKMVRFMYTLILQASRMDEYMPEYLRIKPYIARIVLDHLKEVPLTDINGQPIPDEEGNQRVIQMPKTDDELVQELGEFVPASKLDVKVLGYENNLKKRETLQKLNEVVRTLYSMQDPEVIEMINKEQIVKQAFRLSDLDENELTFDEKERMDNFVKKLETSSQMQMIMQQMNGVANLSYMNGGGGVQDVAA